MTVMPDTKDPGKVTTAGCVLALLVPVMIQGGVVLLAWALHDILATRRLLQETRPDDVGVSVSYPLPGTRFYEQVREQLRGKTHWQESNDLEMMFEGTYRSDFYRQLRNLLHDEVTQHGSAELARRWDELLAREAEYRNDAGSDAVAPAPGLLLHATTG